MPTNHGQILRQHGDITGRRFLATQQRKDDRRSAVLHTTNSLNDGTAITIIPEQGGAPWAVPTRVVELVKVMIEAGVL